jgi:hypothetical protein
MRYAAVALCAALAFTACTKSTDSTSTTSDATQTTAPDANGAAGASAAPGASATSAGEATTTTAAPAASATMSVSANGGSLVIKIYSTKDDAKTVADWYKSNLPSTWKGGVMTAGSKTIGTFSNELTDGVQSVVVGSEDDTTTHIQLTTKHGK